jgi:hypothetical protein
LARLIFRIFFFLLLFLFLFLFWVVGIAFIRLSGVGTGFFLYLVL